MRARTKKVGLTGWMGPRYGIRIRRRVLEIDRGHQKPSPCPRCSTVTLWRVSSGIYECERCGVRLASGAYAYSPAPPISRQERGAAEAAPPTTPAAATPKPRRGGRKS
jgi:large subunit ribosomal protein L37Ae